MPIAAAGAAPIASTAAAGLSAGAGSIISSGLSMLGGLFGSRKDSRNQARLEEREDSRFQRASKDAKLAGLHPLFALGAAGAGSPQFLTGQSETGSAAGDVLKGAARGISKYSKTTDPLSAQLNQIGLKLAESNLRKSLIDEQLLASELRRETQNSGVIGADREFRLPPATVSAEKMKGFQGLVEAKPMPQITSQKGDPSEVASSPEGHPLWQKFRYGSSKGAFIWVPWSEEGPAESLQGMSPALWSAIIAKNGYESAMAWWRLGKKGKRALGPFRGAPKPKYSIMP